MSTGMRAAPLTLACLLIAIGLTLWPGTARGAPSKAPASPPAEKQPSANKGRTGTYECKTSRDGYNYYVCVPKTYSDASPAGLHLYFHGQGGGGGAPNFGQWAKDFIEPCNLIGINMQYTDGDNAKDTGGKVDAAIEAIRQTVADYKVILGRGAVASFSGGGLPHEKLFEKFGKFAPGGPSPCPFNHSSLYSSNYWADVTNLPPMSWFIGLGGKEWNMAGLGSSQVRRADQLFGLALKGGCADIYLKITKDKGHEIADADARDSAWQFRRSDLAFAPFLYERDYPEPQIAVIVHAANTLALGRAAASADRLLADAKADEKVKARTAAVRKKIEDRIDAALALAKELADADPALLAYYGNIFTQQLGPHPKAKDLKDLLAQARKQPAYQPAVAACGNFWANSKSMFQSGRLAPGGARFLEDAKARSGENSLVGKMAAEFLLMQGP